MVGFARRDLSDEEFRDHLLRGDQQAQPQPAGEEGDLGVVRQRHRVPPRRLRRPGRATSSSRSGSTASTATAGPPATGSSTLPCRRPVPGDRQAARSGRPGGSRRSAPRRIEARLDAGHRREAVRLRPRQRQDAEPRARPRSSTRSRSTGSTTTSARRRSRTWPSSASATASSSRSGTGATSTRSRSPWPRRSGSRGAASSTTRPARCATSSRTTACS